MKKILIVVDYQNDFVDPQGVLPVPNAIEIVENIQREIDNNIFDRVIYTMDTHTDKQYHNSEEEKLFPNIHCNIETEGWKLYKITPRNPEIQKKMIQAYNLGKTFVEVNNEVMFVKDQFDIWEGNSDWEKWFLSNFDKNIEIYISGVATEFCVKFNALGYSKRGFNNVFIKENSIAALDNSMKEISFKEFEEKKIKIIKRT